MRLLFVCTGNVCRSPIAAGLAAAWSSSALGHAGTAVQILSAGLAAPMGRPMDRHSAAALSRLGGAASMDGARAFVPKMADDADLVLTMTRGQRRAVLEVSPRGLHRTFTLLEAADLMGETDLRGLESLRGQERARELGRRLSAGRARRASTDADDIEDPIDRRATHRTGRSSGTTTVCASSVRRHRRVREQHRRVRRHRRPEQGRTPPLA